MRILFITRCYPPVIGGMEKVSFELTSHLTDLTSTDLIANRRGKRNLLLFLPYALFRAVYLIKLHSIDIVHLSDALLAPLGAIIKKVCRIPVVSTVHGLDVTYNSKLYQWIIPASLKKLDQLVCISSYTCSQCLERGILSAKCRVVPNGINPDEFYLEEAEAAKKLQTRLKIELSGKRLLLSVGHLVARKGFSWFIREVMPELPPETVYLIIGGYGNASCGNELEAYSQLVKELKLKNRVFLLGKVSHEILSLAYNCADLLVMPNIEVQGDMEGFGIVAVEAASCGLPVVGANLEGIPDGVVEGKTGFLVEPGNVQGFVHAILTYQGNREFKQKVREYAIEHFDWDRIASCYLQLFQELTSDAREA
ncbi:MAG: glycosyltransferase family 4 protein [bacterium]